MYFILLAAAWLVFARASSAASNASITEFPYHVSVELKDWPTDCQGAVISEDWIVTSTVCTWNTVKLPKVRTGTDIYRTNGSMHQVDTIVKHEKGFNIALMHVNEKFPPNTKIEMFASFEKPQIGKTGKVTGFNFGMNKVDNHTILTHEFQWVDVTVEHSDECSQAYNSTLTYGQNSTEGLICAAVTNVDSLQKNNSCLGHEGAPLAIGGRLAGFFSGGFYPCGNPENLAFYTDVGFHRKWIDQQLKLYGELWSRMI